MFEGGGGVGSTWQVWMGSINNRVGVLEGSITTFMKKIDNLEIIGDNIQEQLVELTSIMKSFLLSSSLTYIVVQQISIL
jgi:hypothetical protein